MSQHNHGSKGRRTPLSLGQQQPQQQHHHNSKSNARKASSDSNNSTTTADSRSAAVTSNNQNQSEQLVVEQLKQKITIDMQSASTVVGPKSAKENALRKMMQQQQQRNNAQAAPTVDSDVIVIGEDDAADDASAAAAKKESGKRNDKNSAGKKDNNGTAAAAKTVDANHKNGNGKAAAASPTTPVVVAAAPSPPAVVEVTESSRQKVLREKHEREEAERAKLQEAREIEAALAAFRAQEEAEKATAAAAVDVPKTPEKGRRTKDKAAVVTPSKKTPTSKPTTPVSKAAVVAEAIVPPSPSTKSSAASDDDVMEPLCMETESVDAVEVQASASPPPTPPTAVAVSVSPKPSTGKILKFTQSPVPAAVATARASARLSPFAARRRSGDLNAAGVDAAVNLSTVSEQSNEHSRYGSSPAMTAAAATAAAVASDSQKYSGSLRQVTGRRSMRPLRELALQQSSRETYRRTRTELDADYSISSTNVTVGSEIGGDQQQSDDVADIGDNDLAGAVPDSPPVAAVRGRKRLGGAAGGSEPDLVSAGLLLESPKKPRLDLSGFFGMMASPVTLLRNKFSRTSLLCSTPNAKRLDVDVPLQIDDDVEAEKETAIVADDDVDMQQIDDEPKALGEANDDSDAVVKVADQTDLEAIVAEAQAVEETPIDGGAVDGCGDEPIAADAIVVEGEKQPPSLADEVTVTLSKPKKLGSCAVM